MGDKRFRDLYRRVCAAEDPAAEIRALSDAQVVSALAATSEHRDPYLANVLATEALNRLARRERLEARLRESEARFRLAARAVTDAVWDVDLRRGTVWRGGGYHETFGYGPRDTERASEWWATRIHPDDRDRVAAAWQAWLDDPQDVWEARFRIRRGDGGFAHVLDRGYLIRDGGGRPMRAVGAMVDITGLHHTESALAEREARCRAMEDAADCAGLGVAIITPGGHGEPTIDAINTAGARLLGRDADALEAQPLTNILAPGTGARALARIESALRGADDPVPATVRVRRPDGATACLRMGLSRTERRGRTAAVAVLRDVPEE